MDEKAEFILVQECLSKIFIFTRNLSMLMMSSICRTNDWEFIHPKPKMTRKTIKPRAISIKISAEGSSPSVIWVPNSLSGQLIASVDSSQLTNNFRQQGLLYFQDKMWARNMRTQISLWISNENTFKKRASDKEEWPRYLGSEFGMVFEEGGLFLICYRVWGRLVSDALLSLDPRLKVRQTDQAPQPDRWRQPGRHL